MIREHRNDNQLRRTGRIYFKQLPQSRSVVPVVLNPVTIRLISQSSPPEWTGDTLTSLYCWEFFMVIHFPYYPHKEQYTNRLWVSLSQSMKPVDVTQESEQDLPLSLSTIVLKHTITSLLNISIISLPEIPAHKLLQKSVNWIFIAQTNFALHLPFHKSIDFIQTSDYTIHLHLSPGNVFAGPRTLLNLTYSVACSPFQFLPSLFSLTHPEIPTRPDSQPNRNKKATNLRCSKQITATISSIETAMLLCTSRPFSSLVHSSSSPYIVIQSACLPAHACVRFHPLPHACPGRCELRCCQVGRLWAISRAGLLLCSACLLCSCYYRYYVPPTQ